MRWTILGVVLVMVVAGIDVIATYRGIDRVEFDAPSVDDGAETWLLIGSDNRAAAVDLPNRDAFGTTEVVAGARADVLVLVQAAHDGQPARVVSIPRDLIVFRPGTGADRLALTFLDSPTATVRSICGTLGVAVDHVAIIEFDALAELVDEVGGIEVSVEHPTRDLHTGLDLPAGTSQLDGGQALAWVRARHREVLSNGAWVAERGGDRVRQESQRQLLSDLAGKMARQARAPWATRRLARAVADGVAIDADAGPLDLLRLGRTLADDPESTSLPHRATSGAIPAAEVTPEAQGLLDALRSGSPSGAECPRALPQPG